LLHGDPAALKVSVFFPEATGRLIATRRTPEGIFFEGPEAGNHRAPEGR